jgi:hypothetical protein
MGYTCAGTPALGFIDEIEQFLADRSVPVGIQRDGLEGETWEWADASDETEANFATEVRNRANIALGAAGFAARLWLLEDGREWLLLSEDARDVLAAPNLLHLIA